MAQDKVKNKDDKTKVKDKDSDAKLKEKADKFKVKEDENKMKLKAENGQQTAAAMSSTDLPYTASYSSNFAIGNAAHSKIILDLWKDWDDNAFDRHDYFADTATMILPDGEVLKGKATITEGAKTVRGGLTSAKSTLDAWIPLRSVDRNEDWVAVWGHEEDVHSDGKTEKRELHEIWRINKDGKIDYMQQWTATPPAQN
jgi:hypothetical protein